MLTGQCVQARQWMSHARCLDVLLDQEDDGGPGRDSTPDRNDQSGQVTEAFVADSHRTGTGLGRESSQTAELGEPHREQEHRHDADSDDEVGPITVVARFGHGDPVGLAGNFFSYSTTSPALTLAVVPVDTDGIAVGVAGAGQLDGSLADKISQLGTGPGSPDNLWESVVTGIGVQSRGAQQHESLTSAAEISAQSSRASQASVSLDEENVSLLTNQRAYQAAARVMTAVDEALDVLINRTGLVGR